MIRLLLFIVVVLALGLGFAWLADRPGAVVVDWQGQQIETSLLAAVAIVVALIVAILIIWWLVRTLLTSPHLIRRHLKARKRDRGYQALSTGLIAAGAGDAVAARRMNKRTQGLLDPRQEPLIHLLEAQTALIEGDHDAARAKFESMEKDPETRALALRGLYLEARRVGADEAARHYIERAVDAAPHLPWAGRAALELRSREGDWDGAIRLLEKQRMARIVKRPEADRKKAVLLTARAIGRLKGDPRGARDDALEAIRLAPDLVPAAITAAKALYREDNVRKGAKILEKAWKAAPHPEIAETYVRARMGDSVLDRLKRAERLEALKPNNIESLLAVARAALDAQQFTRAREKAEAAARQQSRDGIYLLLADIEEAATGDLGRVRHWLAQAVRAQPDPAWTADDYVAEKWMPVSPVTGKLDAFVWRVPAKRPPERIESGQAQSSQIEHAIRTLPPIHEQATIAPAHEMESGQVDAEIVAAEDTAPSSATISEKAPSSPPSPAPVAPASASDAPSGEEPEEKAESLAVRAAPEKTSPASPSAGQEATQATTSGPATARERIMTDTDKPEPGRGDGAATSGDASAGRPPDNEAMPVRPPDDPGVENEAPAASKRRFGLF